MTLPLRDSVNHPRRNAGTKKREAFTLRVPNYRLLGGTFIVLALSLPIFYFWHALQVSRQAGSYLTSASEAERLASWDDAQRYLHMYHTLVPDDADAIVRLATAIERGAGSAQARLSAVPFYLKAIALDPSRNDLRVRVAQLQLASSPEAALHAAMETLENDPDQKQAVEIRAAAMFRLLDPEVATPQDVAEVIAALQFSLDKNPSGVQSAVMLATLYRMYRRELSLEQRCTPADLVKRADVLMEEMVARNPEKAEAYLARHEYLLAHAEDRTQAEEDVRQAMQLDPNNPQIRLAAAQHLLEMAFADPLAIADRSTMDEPRLDEAEGHLRMALQRLANDARPYVGIAYVAMLRGEHDEAIQIIRHGLANVDPQHPLLNAWMSNLLIETESWKEADDSIRTLRDIAMSLRERRESLEESKRYTLIAQILRAHWYLGGTNPKRSYAEASQALREADRISLGEEPMAGASFRLAQAHAALGQWDLASTAYAKAAELLPYSVLPRIGRADALRRAGRFDESSREYQKALEHRLMVAKRGEAAPLWIDLARAQLGSLLTTARSLRDWASFHETLERTRRADPENLVPIVLQLESWLAGAELRPEELSLLFGGSPINTRGTTSSTDATSANEQASHRWEARYREIVASDQVESATTSFYAPGPAAPPPLPPLKPTSPLLVGAPEYSPIAPRAEMFDFTSATMVSEALLRAQAAANPEDLVSRWHLGLLAAGKRDPGALARWQDELEAIEGPEGTYWRFLQVHTFLLQAQLEGTAAVERAGDASRFLRTHRPEWCMTRMAEGMVAEAKGTVADAIASYQSAIDLGHRGADVYQHSIGLQLASGYTDPAWRDLQALPEYLACDPKLVTFYCHQLVARGHHRQAVDLARELATQFPEQAELQILLGICLSETAGTGPLEEATRCFERARALAPQQLYAHVAYLTYLLRQEVPGRSVAALEQLRLLNELLLGENEAISPPRAAAMVASSLHYLGDFRLAERYWRQAVLLAHSDPFAKELPLGAYVKLENIDSADSLWSADRRTFRAPVSLLLGMVFLASHQSTDHELGRDLLQREPVLAAIALLARGTSSRAAAMRQLSEIPREDWSSEELELAALVAREGGREKEAFAYLSESKSLSTAGLVLRAELALDLGEIGSCQQALAALSEADIDADLLLSLRVQLLHAEGKDAEAISLAQNSAEIELSTAAPESETNRWQRAEAAADAMTSIGQAPKAGQWLWSRATSLEERFFALDWMVQHSTLVSIACERCIELADQDPGARSAQRAARLLASGELRAEKRERLESLLKRMDVAVTPENDDLQAEIARWQEAAGKPDEAFQRTEETLQHAPDHLPSLRNRAWLLTAYQTTPEESWRAIQETMARSGPNTETLDILALAHLKGNRVSAAIRVLETIVAECYPSGTSYLHLAEAYQAADRRSDSLQALATAKRLGLGPLRPRDQLALDALQEVGAAAK